VRHLASRLGSAVDARRIVEQASGRSGAELVASAGEPVTRKAALAAEAMLVRRLGGEPLQYVLGSWGFRSLDLFVDRRVLIPRPETEVVVEVALAELARIRAGSQPGRRLVAVDLGTGSGAIALSLAAEGGEVDVWATDVSAVAIDVARANLAGLAGRAATQVSMAEGSWFEALAPSLAGRIDLIASNPPYVAAGDELPEEVSEWEPMGALVCGPTGLEATEHILCQAPGWMSEGGSVVLEVAHNRAAESAAIARAAGFDEVEVRRDLAGRDRVLVARLGAGEQSDSSSSP
jgi:release factor glutamine methyltransferase